MGQAEEGVLSPGLTPGLRVVVSRRTRVLAIELSTGKPASAERLSSPAPYFARVFAPVLGPSSVSFI